MPVVNAMGRAWVNYSGPIKQMGPPHPDPGLQVSDDLAISKRSKWSDCNSAG